MNREFDSEKSFSYAVSIGDLDLDGDMDIVIGNSRGPNAVFINEKGGQSCGKIQLAPQEFNTYDIIVADLNKDGRLDIIESNSDEINKYYFNSEKK